MEGPPTPRPIMRPPTILAPCSSLRSAEEAEKSMAEQDRRRREEDECGEIGSSARRGESASAMVKTSDRVSTSYSLPADMPLGIGGREPDPGSPPGSIELPSIGIMSKPPGRLLSLLRPWSQKSAAARSALRAPLLPRLEHEASPMGKCTSTDLRQQPLAGWTEHPVAGTFLPTQVVDPPPSMDMEQSATLLRASKRKYEEAFWMRSLQSRVATTSSTTTTGATTPKSSSSAVAAGYGNGHHRDRDRKRERQKGQHDVDYEEEQNEEFFQCDKSTQTPASTIDDDHADFLGTQKGAAQQEAVTDTAPQHIPSTTVVGAAGGGGRTSTTSSSTSGDGALSKKMKEEEAMFRA
jgi:hypothetical protein